MKSSTVMMKTVGLCFVIASAAVGPAWAQPASIQNGCSGKLGTAMTQIAKPYQQAVAALHGTEAGWCAMATEHDADTPENAAV